MGHDPGSNHELSCAACAYSLRGHAVEGGGVRCPECGRTSTVGELLEAAAAGRFRWWVALLFLAPAALLIAIEHFWTPGLYDAPILRAGLVPFLYSLAHWALGDHRGVERVGTAAVLTIFLWLTNNLLATAYPLMTAG